MPRNRPSEHGRAPLEKSGIRPHRRHHEVVRIVQCTSDTCVEVGLDRVVIRVEQMYPITTDLVNETVVCSCDTCVHRIRNYTRWHVRWCERSEGRCERQRFVWRGVVEQDD